MSRKTPLALISIIILLGCMEWELDKFPTFDMQSALLELNATDGVATISTTIIGLFEEGAVPSFGHCWSSSNSMPVLNDAEAFTQYGNLETDSTFRDLLEDLDKEQNYYVRAYIRVDKDVIYGDVLTFTTGGIWKQLTDFEDVPNRRWQGVSFELNEKYYIGLGATSCFDGNSKEIYGQSGNCIDGRSYPVMHKDFWQFDPENEKDPWIKDALPALPGPGRRRSVAFTIDDHVYVGLGEYTGSVQDQFYNAFYKLGPSTGNQWELIPFPEEMTYMGGTVAFSLNGKGYVGLGNFQNYWYGSLAEYPPNFYAFDPATETWTPIASYPGIGRANATVFVLNGKAYVGTGHNNRDPDKYAWLKDFYEYTPETDSWKEIARLEGNRREAAVSFAIGEYGYVVTGSRGFPVSDYWRYDPKTDQWKQIAYDPGMAVRRFAMGFAIEGRGYVFMGKINYRSMGRTAWMYVPL